MGSNSDRATVLRSRKNRGSSKPDPTDHGTTNSCGRIESREDGNTSLEKHALNRRGYLAIVGAVVGTHAVGSGLASAEEDQGYGAGMYGDGAYGGTDADSGGAEDEVTPPSVVTVGVDAVTASSATLVGELVDLGSASEVSVFFEHQLNGSDDWSKTSAETLVEPGAFEHEVSSLDAAMEYRYRAVAEGDGERESGTTKSFVTENPETSEAPTIDRLAVEDVSPPNPHVDLEVQWVVSDLDGDLRTGTIAVSDGNGPIESTTLEVTDSGGDGTEQFRIKHGAGSVYEVTLEVSDAAGNRETKTEIIETSR